MAVRFTCLNHQLAHQRDPLVDDMHARERRWFAVRTASKHEKSAVKMLEKAGVEAYTPLREKTYNYTSKKVIRALPLLSGYVFVRINQAEERKVLSSQYVARFVTIGRERRRVTEAEMELLKRISTDRSLNWAEVEQVFDFTEGTPVEIIRGPLAGIRGTYLNKKNKKTFVISLGGLNTCLTTCEIDPTFLVALEGVERQAGEAAGTKESREKMLW